MIEEQLGADLQHFCYLNASHWDKDTGPTGTERGNKPPLWICLVGIKAPFGRLLLDLFTVVLLRFL